MNISDFITLIAAIIFIVILVVFANIAIIIIFGGLLLVGIWFFIKTSVKRFYNYIKHKLYARRS